MSVSVERLGDAQVIELALAAAQPAADPAPRVGRAERAEQHGDELPPAREPARMALGVRPLDQGLELRLRKQLEELAEPAAKSTRTLGGVAGQAGVPRSAFRSRPMRRRSACRSSPSAATSSDGC